MTSLIHLRINDELYALWLLQHASPKNKDIFLQNHSILITLRKINVSTIPLSTILIRISLLGRRMFFIAGVRYRGQILPAACFHKWRFSWNTDTLRHVHIVYGCFCATAAELSGRDRDCVSHKAWSILPSHPLRKRVLTRALLALVSSRIQSRLILCIHFWFLKNV